jgi:hypothetical protein
VLACRRVGVWTCGRIGVVIWGQVRKSFVEKMTGRLSGFRTCLFWRFLAEYQSMDVAPGPVQKPGEILVFLIQKETKCSECGEELFSGTMITLAQDRGALCLACADLDHLEFLASGDAALTRRASKYSKLKAVVLRWSRTRKRYERQGVLAETEAIEQAETECLADAEQRQRKAERRAEREAALDQRFVREFARAIVQQFPRCPANEATRIAEHACRKYSGRVGRSAAAKRLDPEAIRLATVASVRHRFTDYDLLLVQGVSRAEAREQVYQVVQEKLGQWRA